jgi:CheY-like chemotaxis protein
MAQLMETVRDRPRAEALPTWRDRARAPWSSAGGPPADDDDLAAGFASLDLPESTRLPRILDGVGVLVVDDDADTADLFATALSACGADVVAANSAREALRILGDRALDVVVTDIAMAGGDGYWLLGEIRGSADERTRDMPVLAATAFGRTHFRGRTLAAGFTEHLEKPVDPEALCRAVARAIGR